MRTRDARWLVGVALAVAGGAAGCATGPVGQRVAAATTGGALLPAATEAQLGQATRVHPVTGSLLETYQYYVAPDSVGSTHLVLHGTYAAYFDDGAARLTGSYRNGKLDGTWLSFAPDGEVTTVWRYVAGERKEMLDCTRGECGGSVGLEP